MNFQERITYVEANLYSQKTFTGERISLRFLYTNPSFQAIIQKMYMEQEEM